MDHLKKLSIVYMYILLIKNYSSIQQILQCEHILDKFKRLLSIFCSNYFVLPSYRYLSTNRTHIALLELSLPFDMTEVSGMPKPDWYLKINPVSSIADGLFFLSIFWFNFFLRLISKSVGKSLHSEYQPNRMQLSTSPLSAMSFYVTTQQNCKIIIL